MQNTNDQIQILEDLANKYLREENYSDAKLIYKKLLNTNDKNHLYLARLAYIELILTNLDNAKSLFLQSISICPAYIEAYNCLGYIFKLQGDFSQAKDYFNQALSIDHSYIPALTNLAVLVLDKEPKKAIKILEKALSFNNNDVNINFNLGLAYLVLKDYQQAIIFLKKVILIKPNFSEAIFNLGNANFFLRRFTSASSFYQKVISLDDSHVDAYSNLGTCFKELGDLKNAINFYNMALKLNPSHVNTLSNLAVVMIDLRNTNDAIDLLNKVIKIDSQNSIYWFNIANAFKEKGEFLTSIKYLEKAISIDNDFHKAYAELIHLKGRLCMWSDYSNDKRVALKIGIESDIPSVHLGMLAMHDDPEVDLLRAKKFYQYFFNLKQKVMPIKNKHKIRLGYISANFYDHPVIQLLIRTLELHDKSKFELYLYSLDSNTNDDYTARIKSVDAKFIAIDHFSNKERIDLIRSHDLDLVIDLMGYTKGNNFFLFAHRIAPIQISYLGYPGTTGSNCMDYIIADRFLIPKDLKKYYSEKVVYLPLTYQCNDDKLPKVNQSNIFNRDDKFKEKFVFTCFNSTYKISPIEFDIWMNLLRRVERSVLWLYESSEDSKSNLIQSANNRGIDSTRLFFAKALPLKEHIKRHQNADLCLDTFNYSAGATAFISLKASIPIVSYVGQSYTSRMSSSILKSLGLTSLIAEDFAEYEEIAFNLATNDLFFSEIKNKLYDLNLNSDFFNSYRFVKDYEALLTELYINNC